MRNKIIRSRLLLLCAGAVALVTLAACGPDVAVNAPAPSQPATTDLPASAPEAAPPAPSNPLEVPPPIQPDTAAADSTDATPIAAEDTVRRYYAAINAKDYATAYALWGNGGAASRQTFDAFAGGYKTTRSVQATVGKAFGQEGAMGSRYIQVPIDLASQHQDGSSRHYRGSLTLRAVVADGASAQQRQWHLDSADLEGYEPPAPAPAQPDKSP